VLTAFLRTGRLLDHASSVLLLGTFLLMLQPASLLAGIALMAALLFALVEKYFAWRVALDAELFEVLCELSDDPLPFDLALADFLGRTEVPTARSMESRWKGARRLFRNQVILFLCQNLAVLITVAIVAR
jgi:hypothetical protein